MLSTTFKVFASNTSMHGVKYIVDERNRPCERKFWAVVLVLSIASCIYMVGLLWNTFESKPPRVYTETTEAPTDVIAFPAVTICNTNIISKRKVKEFVEQLRLYNEDRQTIEKAFEVFLAFKFNLNIGYNKKDLDILQEVLTRNRYTITEVVSNISRTCDEVLVKCSWKGRVVTCGNIFQKSITSTGYCCSFNYNILEAPFRTGHNKINSSRKHRSSDEYTLYPGFMMGLSVLLNPYEEKEKMSYRLTNGMEVAIHHSRNYPAERTYRKTLSTGFQTFLQVSGSSLRASDEVRILPRNKRGCILPSEGSLRYLGEYTEINCYVECRMLYTLSVCGCVPYFLDFGAGPVCDLSGIPCLFNLRFNKNVNFTCSCPSTCANENYDITSSSTGLVNSKASTWSFMTDVNVTKESILLNVFFTSQVQSVYRTDVADSRIYLLASIGGIFGLFLGWSFITGAEIIYYFIVRLILQRQRNDPKNRRDILHKRRRTPSFIYEPKQYLP